MNVDFESRHAERIGGIFIITYPPSSSHFFFGLELEC